MASLNELDTNISDTTNTVSVTFDTSNTEWEAQNSLSNWQRPDDTSSSESFVFDGGTVSTGTDNCNESLVHSNVQKAIFHGMKGADRMVDEGQAWAALRMAGTAANAYLETEGEEYDPERSEEYLYDRIVDEAKSTVEVIEAGIERAFAKIDSGNHTGGARIAISVADAYLDGFEPAQVTD